MILRSSIHITFVALLVTSLACSIAMQAGHADVPVAESAQTIQPLKVGENAPLFEVETVDGAPFNFDPQHLERPVLLLAYRGGWCPYCNTYLSEMRHVIPKISQMGVDILFLSGDRPNQLYESLSMETQSDIGGLDYTILSDADADAAIALGIAFKASQRTINRRHEKGQDIAGSSMIRHGILPVPAAFAVDRNGIIRFAYTNADYKVRLPAEQLLQATDKITADD